MNRTLDFDQVAEEEDKKEMEQGKKKRKVNTAALESSMQCVCIRSYSLNGLNANLVYCTCEVTSTIHSALNL